MFPLPFSILCLLLQVRLSASASTFARSDDQPRPALSTIHSTENVARNFVSATLGDHMVLQRDQPAVIWGYTKPGARVQATLMSDTYKAKADKKGLWKVTFPPQPASLDPTTIDVMASTGEKQTLKNVLFGDVYICGGQSNMEFSFPGQDNGTQVVQEAIDHYSHIRVVTIGCYTQSTTPLPDLQKVESTWSLPTQDSMSKAGLFGRFSAVCYFFGKEISDHLNHQVPLGLINNNWGGSPIENWLNDGAYFNAMIYPYQIGPMAITGFTWYQGEANLDNPTKYKKDFAHLIDQWREGFQNPDAYFGFVQLSTWCPKTPELVAEFRQAQMSVLTNNKKNIGYATNADHGAGCNIHPRDKSFCGKRLGRSALALQYGQTDIHWKSPTYKKAVQEEGAVVIEFQDVTNKGLYILENPYNNRLDPAVFNCTAQREGTCAWAEVLLNGLGWITATLAVRDGNKVVMTPLMNAANDGSKKADIVASSYGWGAVPMMQLYDTGTDLPVLPWKEKV